MIQQISKVVGVQIIRYCSHISDATLARQADLFVQIIRYCSHVSDATLARQADRFVAVSISSCR